VKRILFITLFFVIAVNLNAKENTTFRNQNSLIGLNRNGLGGYRGPQFCISKTNGESGMTGGGPSCIQLRFGGF
jgi:hypothetical protein